MRVCGCVLANTYALMCVRFKERKSRALDIKVHGVKGGREEMSGDDIDGRTSDPPREGVCAGVCACSCV